MGIKSKIGVTTGEAFLGDVGNQERREYAVVGDIVVCFKKKELKKMKENEKRTRKKGTRTRKKKRS